MKNKKEYYVYIMTNKRNTVLYTGVTSDLGKRVYEHKGKLAKSSFSSKYNVDKLVYYEEYNDVLDAIAREKQIKAGPRWRKERLIDKMNPKWRDLYLDLFGDAHLD